MSIIADTLQRLQTQTNGEGSDTPDAPSIVIPARRKREPGWHTPPSRLKFWLAGLGMALGLSGLGLVAYWIGLNLDFGMSTYASPRISKSISLSVSSPTLESGSFDSPSSESVQVSAANSVQDVPSSTSRQLGGEPSANQDAVSPETPYPPNTENPLPTPLLVAVPVSSETEVGSISHTLRQPHQTTMSTNVSTPNSATDTPPQKESSKPKTASTSLPAASSAQSDKPGSKLVESEKFDVTENRIPEKAALEEERMSMEHFSSPAHQSLDATPLLPSTTAMIPKKDERPQAAQAPAPVQLSPTNRLGHAQQLIQAGKYEEAVSFLSPLIEDSPVNWEPWFWMGTALLGQDDLEQADQFFLSGLARNDKIPQLWIQRALVAHQRGDYQLAIHELQRAESLDTALPHIHLNMGYAYEKLGNDRLANDYYAKFLKLSEGNPAFFSIRKKLYARFTEQVHSTSKPGLPSSLPENSSHTHELSRP
jgi:Flp pilus assembly protein TadD